ncbi:hypothetical protein SFC50_03135 [Bacillus infantis]|uniref:hypothetical protein n=1 Tax=Bacillus infantis TaxID=324767 RepID=UPI0039822125
MKINITKFTSATIALVPWIGNYRFLVSGFSLGELLIIIALFLNLIKGEKTSLGTYSKTYRILLLYYIYAILAVFIITLIGNDLNYELVLKRTIKMGLYFIAISLLLPGRINIDYFLKVYKLVVYFSCIAIIIQYLAYYIMGTYVVFKIPFLSFSSDSAEEFNYIDSRLFSFRPDSIFLEPSHFVYYVIGYIIVCLFLSRNTSPKILEAALVSVCVLMSKSSFGIFVLVVIWLYFLITQIIKKKISTSKKMKIIISVITIGFTVIILYLNSDLYESFSRLQNSSYTSGSGAWAKASIGDVFTNSLGGFQKLFGVGLGNYPTGVFSTTVNFVFYCTGYIGIIIMSYWALRSFVVSNHIGRVMILCTVMLFFVWYLIYAPIFILYNALIINNKK